MIDSWLEPLPLVAILRGLTPDEAVAIGGAVIEAGFRILEVPLNSPEPMRSIKLLSDAFGDRALVGAGTVLTTAQVNEVAGAGGKLIVMPHGDVAVIAEAKRQGLYCIPGIATPTEAFAAFHAGADALKIFAAEHISPAVVKAWRAVLPKTLALLPVGGITPENMGPYVAAGVRGFGIGSALYAPGRSGEDTGTRARKFAQAWALAKAQAA
jgi:2-dehydro-3-deoxyphosphogalactonate aldolase